jgi:OOP family OmpA-OmpF porin
VVADADGDGVPDSRDACPDTPRSYAVDDRGCPIPLEEVARIDLKINFDFDRAEVKAEFLPEIRRVADFMTQYPDVIIELEGHTDSTGTEEYNLGLSQRRVNAVRDVLVGQMRMQASRITVRGFGESQPVAANTTAAGRAENRRVVSVAIKTVQRFQPR